MRMARIVSSRLLVSFNASAQACQRGRPTL
jgi:hypothetical protein